MTLDDELKRYDRLVREGNQTGEINTPDYKAMLSRKRMYMANCYEFDLNKFKTVYSTWREYRRKKIEKILTN